MTPLPFRALTRALDARARRAVASRIVALEAWQRSLRRWPTPSSAGIPDATPFVSIYVSGKLRGCFGATLGDPGERLARAYLGAVNDTRFGGVGPDGEPRAVEVAFPTELERVALGRAADVVEPGSDALAFAAPGVLPVLVLPSVARDGAMDARALLELVAKKAGLRRDELGRGTLHRCRTESVVVRASAVAARPATPEAAARDWLLARVDRRGAIAAGCDPRSGEIFERTAFHHGRAAIVLMALSEHAGTSDALAKARRWLAGEISRALRGRAVEAWPKHPAEIAGTLALACLAGQELRAELAKLAASPELAAVPWHAAQVVAALGPDAPRSLWRACVADLEAHPWAPWTAIAARRVGDGPALERVERALVASIRKRPPFEGGADVRAVPELALTAVAVEALAGSTGSAARTAVKRAGQFLLRHQVLAEPVAAAYRPELARGGFPLSPVLPQQRSDVTAHALRALRIARLA